MTDKDELLRATAPEMLKTLIFVYSAFDGDDKKAQQDALEAVKATIAHALGIESVEVER